MKAQSNRFTILCFFLGVLICIIRFGTVILNPLDLSWLRGDSQFHHIGFAFFNIDEWYFPPGVFRNYNFPNVSSIGSTDSIPLMAFLFKILRNYLPENYHYMGIWQLICYGLQGFFGYRIIHYLTKNPLFSIGGAVFLILSPPLTAWRFIHGGLCAQFIILWAIYKYLQHHTKESLNNWTHFSFFTAHFFTSLIHPYILPMIYPIYLLLVFDCNKKNKKVIVIYGAFALITSLFGLFLAGHLAVNGGQDPWGFGYYNTDLLTFINPVHTSAILPGLPIRDGQHEGFAYLGLGMLLMILFLLIRNRTSDLRHFIKEYKLLWIVAILLSFYSLGSNISILGFKLISFSKLYYLLGPIPNIFRSSGRFIWPLFYLINIFSVYYLYRSTHRKKYIILTSFILIQVIDLSPIILNQERAIASEMITRFKDPFHTNSITLNFNGKSLSSFPRKYGQKSCETSEEMTEQQERDIFNFAIKHQLVSTSIMGMARSNSEQIDNECQREWSLIQKGIIEEGKVLVFNNTSYLKIPQEIKTRCTIQRNLYWCF